MKAPNRRPLSLDGLRAFEAVARRLSFSGAADELGDPYGAAGRLAAPSAGWLIPLPGAALGPELRAFIAWARGGAAITRSALGEMPATPATVAPCAPQ